MFAAMNTRIAIVLILLVAAVTVILLAAGGNSPPARSAVPQDEAKMAPDLVLRGIDGRAATSAELRGQVVVLAYNGVECPISKLLADRIRDIAADYADRGVRFFGINANVTDDVEDVRGFAESHRITFPMVKDEGAVISDALGAVRTTDVFVIDREGRLRYHGPVDDQYTLTEGRAMGGKSPSPETHLLRDALDAVLAGKPVPAARVEAPG